MDQLIFASLSHTHDWYEVHVESIGCSHYWSIIAVKTLQILLPNFQNFGAKNLEPILFILKRCDVGFQMGSFQGTPVVL